MERDAGESDCATRLRVLADPTRFAVVEVLLAGPQCVGAINDVVGVEPSLLSHHLRVLRDAGLVIAQREGKAIRYALAPAVEAHREKKAINLGCCLISFAPPDATR